MNIISKYRENISTFHVWEHLTLSDTFAINHYFKRSMVES